jgi:hypothetical protein
MLFALVPLNLLKEGNNTAMPTHGSEGTYVCPMRSGCCFNPGEDADGNTVVLTPHHTQPEHASASGCHGGRQNGRLCISVGIQPLRQGRGGRRCGPRLCSAFAPFSSLHT